jgi:hypothetical protein
LNDGVNDPSLGKNGSGRAATGFARTSAAAPRAGISAGISGTAEQKALINSLVGPVMGVPADQISDTATLLFVPAMAGTEVSVG